MSTKKHNKRRNTGLLYEFLLKHSTNLLFENNKIEANKVFLILRKYFSKGKPLYEELKTFKTLLNTSVEQKETAKKILNEAYIHSEKNDAKQINREKSNLIRDINYNLDSNKVYNYHIPKYKVYATVQTLLNTKKRGDFLDNVEKLKLEEFLIDHIVSDKKLNEGSDLLKKNTKYSNIVYKFAQKRFNEKYNSVLNKEQKNLLHKYSLYLMNENIQPVKDEIAVQVEKIKRQLDNVKDESLKKDSELMNKLQESRKNLSYEEFDKNIDDNKIVKLLKYMELVSELNG